MKPMPTTAEVVENIKNTAWLWHIRRAKQKTKMLKWVMHNIGAWSREDVELADHKSILKGLTTKEVT